MEQEIVLTRKSGSGQPLLSPRRRWSLSMSGFLTLVFIIFAPMPGFAQSSIAGVVTDASNAVLPGVTVEASSPALIEKVRTVITDENGRFQVVDLRPGVYNITFTLAGFKSVVNNRPDFEGGPDQPTSAAIEAAAIAAGLRYVHQPVLPAVQTEADFARFAALLAELPKPILAFCRTGTRSGKLFRGATGG